MNFGDQADKERRGNKSHCRWRNCSSTSVDEGADHSPSVGSWENRWFCRREGRRDGSRSNFLICVSGTAKEEEQENIRFFLKKK